MTARRALLKLAFLLPFATALSGCDTYYSIFGRTYPEYRFRLTVDIETPEGVKSGYSVYAVNGGRSGDWGPLISGGGSRAYGEGVVIDLGKKGPLFVLTGDTPGDTTWAAYIMLKLTPRVKFDAKNYEDKPYGWYDDQRMQRLYARTGRYDVPSTIKVNSVREQKTWPMFVRFRDINDRKSVEEVDPKDLTKTYGKGYELKRITVQLTDEPVTQKMRPWMKHWKLGPNQGLEMVRFRPVDPTLPYTQPSLPQLLGYRNFIIGEDQ
jgi:hypothetical protein